MVMVGSRTTEARVGFGSEISGKPYVVTVRDEVEMMKGNP
jgi:hypothetical protein